MKTKRGIYCLVLACLLSVYLTSAVGVSPPEVSIDFTPGKQDNITLTLLNAGPSPINTVINFGGELAKYIKYNQSKQYLIQPGGTQKVQLTITLPQKITPGKNSIDFTVQEVPVSNATGIAVTGAVGGHIYITAPYPGTYATLSLVTKDANVNEPITLLLTVYNLGKYSITAITIFIDIFDLQENQKESITKTISNIEPGKQESISITLDPKNYPPGDYKIKAYGKYSAIKTNEEETIVRIGHFFVNITKYAVTSYPQDIKKFLIEVESRWNLPIDDVYATFDIYNAKNEKIDTIKTPTISLAPWGTATLSSFWDPGSLAPGAYTAEMTVWYNNEKTSITVPITHKQDQKMNSAWFTIIIILFFLIIDYFWLRRKKRKRETNDL